MEQATTQQSRHAPSRKAFTILLLAMQALLIILYGAFARPLPHSQPKQYSTYFTMYLGVSMMMLIGFGYLMTFIKSHCWSALGYTFLINSVGIQLYLLIGQFWTKAFKGHLNQHDVELAEMNFLAASYCVASILIAFGALLGRVGPLQLLVMSIIQVIFYSLNQAIVYIALGNLDAGGSMNIHAFGAYFGLTVSLVIGRNSKPNKKPQTSYISNVFAYLGTFILWIFWPAFNSGYFSTKPVQSTIIVTNTILALTASCITTFGLSMLLRGRLHMQDILNATISGGVIIGAASGLILNYSAALVIGCIGGAVSTLGYCYLTQKLQKWIGLQDTCGIHNLHAMPGFLGGLLSAIVVASYQQFSQYPTSKQFLQLPLFTQKRSLSDQAGIQVACTFISVLIGIGSGILTGLILRLISKFQTKYPQDYYNDNLYFIVQQSQNHQNKANKISNNSNVLETGQYKQNAPNSKRNVIVNASKILVTQQNFRKTAENQSQVDALYQLKKR